MTELRIKKLHQDATLPTRGSEHAAGLDVCAFLVSNGKEYGKVIMPGERSLIPTKLSLSVPAGYCVKVYPRSGLSHKQGITLANCVGVVDSDYRGELMVSIVNLSSTNQTITHGQRIAQLIVECVEPVEIVEVGDLDETDRGQGGFGSTGE